MPKKQISATIEESHDAYVAKRMAERNMNFSQALGSIIEESLSGVKVVEIDRYASVDAGLKALGAKMDMGPLFAAIAEVTRLQTEVLNKIPVFATKEQIPKSGNLGLMDCALDELNNLVPTQRKLRIENEAPPVEEDQPVTEEEKRKVTQQILTNLGQMQKGPEEGTQEWVDWMTDKVFDRDGGECRNRPRSGKIKHVGKVSVFFVTGDDVKGENMVLLCESCKRKIEVENEKLGERIGAGDSPGPWGELKAV